MRTFNYNRKGKVAIALLSALFGGNISSAKTNYVANQNSRLDSRSSQITSNKLFKPLTIIITTLIGTGLCGFAIWGLTRDKKESDDPTKDDDIKNNKEINKPNNNEKFAEEEIEKHNKKLICDAIELAKQENKLHCDKDLLKNAMFELFERLAKLEHKDRKWDPIIPLWEFFHKKKISKITIEELTNENNKKENCAFLYLDSDDPKEAYGITWLPDNKVSISCSTEICAEICAERINLNQIFENLKSPFENKN